MDDYLLKLLQSRVLTLLRASRSFTSTFRGYDEGPLRIALRSRDVIPTNYRGDTSSNRLEGPPGSRGRFKRDPVTAKFNICGRAARLCLRGANEFAVTIVGTISAIIWNHIFLKLSVIRANGNFPKSIMRPSRSSIRRVEC